MTFRALNKTELAVAKAVGRMKAFTGQEHDYCLNNIVMTHLLVQLGRADPKFDSDMFETRMRQFMNEAEQERIGG